MSPSSAQRPLIQLQRQGSRAEVAATLVVGRGASAPDARVRRSMLALEQIEGSK